MVWVLDLQVALYVLLCIVLVGAGAAVWAVQRRLQSRGGHAPSYNTGLLEALNRAPLGILVLEDLRIAYLNAEARELLHLPSSTPAVLPSTDWTGLLVEDLAASRQDAAGGGSVSAAAGRLRNVTFASGNTVRWWTIAQGARDVILLFDISTQQRALQTGRSLISDLGHELRTPIATLLTHLQILGLDDVGQEVHSQSLQLARHEAERMSRLVNDILELGRLEMADSITRRPVNLLKLVEEAVVQLSPQSVERQIELDVTASGALPLVMGNADRLRQVLLNLLDNAVKYAGAGARVVVSLEAVAGGVRCAIVDTGPGIAPEHLPHIRRRFYRAAPDTSEGSGLGLTIVEAILSRHGAELEIASPVAEDRGTRVQFILPAAGDSYVERPSTDAVRSGQA